MGKFWRKLGEDLPPEWKGASVDHRQLKELIVKMMKARSASLPSSSSTAVHGGDGGDAGFGFEFSLRDPSRSLPDGRRDPSPPMEEQNILELTPVQSREDEVVEFMTKLEEELKKVNDFYTDEEKEYGEFLLILNGQLRILLDRKHLHREHHDRRRRQGGGPPTSQSPDGSSTSTIFSGGSLEGEAETSRAAAAAVGDEESLMEAGVIAALETNGVRSEGYNTAAEQTARGRLRAAASQPIEIRATTPARAISMMSEDLVSSVSEEESSGGGSSGGGDGGNFINRRELLRAEKMVRDGYLQLFRRVDLLQTYSSLNMEAFRKILKKFEKVSGQRRDSANIWRKVHTWHFVCSDKLVRMGKEVEDVFTEHFAGGTRKKAKEFLKPKQPEKYHIVTFLCGLYAGASLVLLGAYASLAYSSGFFYSQGGSHLEIIYPTLSMFALIGLHVFLYGCNIYAWRRRRISHSFIFDFQPSVALGHMDAFLLSAALTASVLAVLIVHLFLRAADVLPQKYVDAVPGAFLLVLVGVLIYPFDVFYRSTRYCFLRVMRKIVFSPFYEVMMVDSFMADQLMSQIPLLRQMAFAACYFMAASFKAHPFETCSGSHQFKLTPHFISFLPYWWRVAQCLRRYFEEGYGGEHLANAGKYLSAMVAAELRIKYGGERTRRWLAIVVATSTGATFYQLFWDFVKDWGLFDLRSENLLLRDRLILENKRVYYFSIVLNFVLRFAWIVSLVRLNVGQTEHRLIEFLLALLEVVRRGHWNFYRMENEHLNSAGDFRAVRDIPLPFPELLSDVREEVRGSRALLGKETGLAGGGDRRVWYPIREVEVF